MEIEKFIFGQEIIAHCWLLIHILFCLKNSWPKNSFKKPQSLSIETMRSYIFQFGFKNEIMPFIAVIVLWISALLINVFYILCLYFTAYISQLVISVLGAFIALLPILVTIMTNHLGKSSYIAQENTPLHYFKKKNMLEAIVHIFIATLFYLVSVLVSYFVFGIRSAIFACAISFIVILFSILLHCYYRMIKDKIFYAFKFVLSGKIKSLNEWGSLLAFSNKRIQKYEGRMEQLIVSYGYENLITFVNQHFVLKVKL